MNNMYIIIYYYYNSTILLFLYQYIYIYYHTYTNYSPYPYSRYPYSALELPCPYEERTHAFTGMLTILRLNPNVLLNNKTNLYSYLSALSAWQLQEGCAPPAEILHGCREVLVAVRAHNPQIWNKVVGKFQLHYDWYALVQTFELQE